MDMGLIYREERLGTDTQQPIVLCRIRFVVNGIHLKYLFCYDDVSKILEPPGKIDRSTPRRASAIEFLRGACLQAYALRQCRPKSLGDTVFAKLITS